MYCSTPLGQMGQQDKEEMSECVCGGGVDMFDKEETEVHSYVPDYSSCS